MKRFVWFSLLGLLTVVTGCTDANDSATPSTTTPGAVTVQPAPPGRKYTLHPTDMLKMQMYQEPDFQPEVSVAQDGTIVLPMLGTVKVGGKTVAETQTMLTERYKEFFKEPNLTIIITKYAERKVYIDGMVGRAGPVGFPNEENLTISRAIAFAGGILPRGARNDVKLTRNVDGKDVTTVIDMDDINTGAKPDIELKENDRIFVRDSHI